MPLLSTAIPSGELNLAAAPVPSAWELRVVELGGGDRAVQIACGPRAGEGRHHAGWSNPPNPMIGVLSNIKVPRGIERYSPRLTETRRTCHRRIRATADLRIAREGGDGSSRGNFANGVVAGVPDTNLFYPSQTQLEDKGQRRLTQ